MLAKILSSSKILSPSTIRPPEEICTLVKKQQLELDMEPQTGSRLEKEYIKAVYCHSAYLTYVFNSTS